MPSAVETLLFSPDGMVTLKALKRSGRSVTVGNFVAATTVRMIGGLTGGVLWAPEVWVGSAGGKSEANFFICATGPPKKKPSPHSEAAAHHSTGLVDSR